MDKIKIAIVDDDLEWLKIMTSFINSFDDIIVLGTATNKRDAILLVNNIKFDVVLMDINLEGNKLDGISAAQSILDVCPVNIIMLTSISDRNVILDSFSLGVKNYIQKENYTEIPDAIRAIIRIQRPMDVLLEEFMRLKKEEQLQILTPPEKEIYKLFEEGNNILTIEKITHKSRNTIKTQIKNILIKLGAPSMKDAVKKLNSKGFNNKES